LGGFDKDFVSRPDLLLHPYWAVASAIAFWTARRINEAADVDDISRVTRLVNGGVTGIAERTLLNHRALALLSR
jgi:putative chitinase